MSALTHRSIRPSVHKAGIKTHTDPRPLDRYPNIHVRVQRSDPTKTTVLREAFEREMRRRFNKLKAAIRTAIIDRDCFGLTNPAGFRVFFNPCYDDQGKFCSTGGGMDKVERKRLISKIKRTKDREKKNKIWNDAELFGHDLQQVVEEMVLTVPKGYYKLKDKVYGRNLVSTINDMYGWQPSLHVDQRLLLGLQVVYPKKIRVSFTLGLDEIQVLQQVVDPTLTTHADPEPPTFRQFDFPTSQAKKEAFMRWLKKQEELGILETIRIPQFGQATEVAWTDIFIKDSYSRGVQRARYEMGKAGYPVPALEGTGGIVTSMSLPFHVERVGAVYSRAFDGLRGITEAMNMQISHILAQGLVDGDNPIPLAKKLIATIDGVNGQSLGITDSLGRFIPAEHRARMLARTEIIRAHHLGNVAELRQWGVAGVNVLAEWITAGFNVCPLCIKLANEGPYTLDKVEKMIPVHPHCKCCVIPRPYEVKNE